jgi:hypothetical protein
LVRSAAQQIAAQGASLDALEDQQDLRDGTGDDSNMAPLLDRQAARPTADHIDRKRQKRGFMRMPDRPTQHIAARQCRRSFRYLERGRGCPE